MKRFKILLVSLILLLYTSNVGVKADIPILSSKSAVLMDAASGRILLENNPHQKLPMASTTKIMTAIVALEYGNLDDIVTIPPEASGIEGSSIWLSIGEEQRLEDLLYGLMLRSGNDAAMAIALHISGSVEDFSSLMNKTAKRIGANNSNFTNPHGLHDENHYTTAYDLALITSYGLRNPNFRNIVATKQRTIPWPGNEWDRAMRNKNKLLWQYEGANGVKTGFTKAAGRCLVSSAVRDNLQLVAVVLNCGPMFEESIEMLDYGFSNYRANLLFDKSQLVANIDVKGGKEKQVSVIAVEDFYLALKEGEYSKIRIVNELPDTVKAPIIKGQQAGVGQVFYENQLVKEIPLLYKDTVEKKSFWDFLFK